MLGTIQRGEPKTKKLSLLKWETRSKLSGGGFYISKAY